MPSDSLYRLTYASTSAFKERGGGTAIDPEVARILRACKVNNPRREVGGVLHYGHGYFFQVLEGPEKAVKEIYEAIAQDERHEHVHTLDARRVSARRFPDWSMKYVPMESEVNQVLQRHGLSQFDPYRFDVGMIDDMIDLLVGTTAPEQEPDQRYQGGRGPFAWLGRLLGRK